ncbi:unknown [Collinsella sp. CAG:289]|nr:unknown [Collinsella sp. CAG:289]
MRKDLVRRSLKGDLSIIEHDDAVTERGKQRHLLLDHHDGYVLFAVDLCKCIENEQRTCRVESGSGLVEYEHAGLQRHDCGDGNLLLLATRERGDLAIAQVGNANGLQGV